MKKTILLFLLTIFVLSCQRNSPQTELRAILDGVTPSRQVFKFPSNKTIDLVGKKGTRIKIDPKDLIFDNGEAVNDSIRIGLLELTTKEELLKANTQTVSNGRWLISGGAYHIQITSNGKQLKFRDGATYEITFPKIAKEPMSVFFGDRRPDGTMNWEEGAIDLQDKKYPVIIEEDSTFLRYDQQYAIDLQVDTLIISKPNGRFTAGEFRDNFPTIDSLRILNDTIYGYAVVKETVPQDSLNNRRNENYSKFWKLQYEVYEAISTNKAGWINVDRFYPDDQERVTVSFNLDEVDLMNQCYISSKRDNLILNVFFDLDGNLKMSFPKKKSFEIFVFGIKEDKLYGSRMTFRTTEKDRSIDLKTKEISIKEIEKYLKLN